VAGYEFTGLTGYDAARPDDIAYSYYRQWLTNARSRLVAIWGSTIGNQILLSISEWNAGLSNPSSLWASWDTASRVQQFYAGWLNMLAGDGTTTGSGTRFWSANNFLIASNADTGRGSHYNLVKQSGTVSTQYDTFKAVSIGDPLR
jgi:hypothetical protein